MRLTQGQARKARQASHHRHRSLVISTWRVLITGWSSIYGRNSVSLSRRQRWPSLLDFTGKILYYNCSIISRELKVGKGSFQMHIHSVLHRRLTIVVLVTLLLLAASLRGAAAPVAHPAAANAGWQEVGASSASGGSISDNSRFSVLPSVAIAWEGTSYALWSDDSSRDDESYVWCCNESSWEEVGTDLEAIDKGIDVDVTVDVDGEPRHGTGCNLGASEYLSSAPIAVDISGPETGIVNVAYTFTATVSPVTVTQPITYVWEATGQLAIIHTGSDLDDTAIFTWTIPSSKVIAVTATNAVGMVTNTHVITIRSGYNIFMPIIFGTYCGPDNYEPNDSCEQAYGSLNPGQTYQSWISCHDAATYKKSDYFYIDINTTSAINIYLTNIPVSTDYDLYLYRNPSDDPNNPAAVSNRYGNEPETISYSPPATGRYYIRVYAYSGYSTSPYSLRVIYD
jgi:hypothetical protein